MLMNRILDSPNSLRDPDRPSRSLKRSTSVASLPTPPRTRHKRSRSQTSQNSEYMGDDHEHSEVDGPERKKRRTVAVLPGHDDEDENAFWTGRRRLSREEEQEKQVAQTDETEENSPSPSMLNYRVKAPVSPPPSRRQPLIQPARVSSTERDAPVTPPRRILCRPSPPFINAFKTPKKYQGTKIWPRRDSPNNPFLLESSEKVRLHSEWDSSDDEDVVGGARAPEGTPTPVHEEKPTITYVFRGQKATFHNPLYDLPLEVVAASKLPIDHPDYEAPEACPPRRLFSAGKRKSRDRSRESASTEGVKRAKIQLSEDHETSGGEQIGSGTAFTAIGTKIETAPFKPMDKACSHLGETEQVQSARKERERREIAAKDRLASQDGLRAGAAFAERDEPARRALGPLRSV